MAEGGEEWEVPADEFDTWLPAPFAKAFLRDQKIDSAEAVATILARASQGLIVGAATSLVWQEGSRERNEPRARVPKDWWRKAYITESYGRFWTVAGDCTVTIKRYPSDITYHLFGVRFRPDGVRLILPSAPLPSSPGRARSPGTVLLPEKVSRLELRQWLRGFHVQNPSAIEQEVVTAAKIHFRGLRVTRGAVRGAIGELGTANSRGNPAISKK